MKMYIFLELLLGRGPTISITTLLNGSSIIGSGTKGAFDTPLFDDWLQAYLHVAEYPWANQIAGGFYQLSFSTQGVLTSVCHGLVGGCWAELCWQH